METTDKAAAVPGRRLEERVALIALALLLLGCVMVMRPFISSLLWAVILCFSCWPLYRRLLRLVGERRTLASLLMSLAMVIIVLLPFMFVGSKLAESVRELTTATRAWIEANPADPPHWLEALPLVGDRAAASWREIGQDSTQLLKALQRFIEPASAWLLATGLKLTAGLLEMALSILITFFLFRDGLAASEWLTASVVRFGGEQGRRLLKVAGETVRGVVYGILGTALFQSVIAGIGFAIAGIPGAGLLAFLTFVVSVVPIGPPLVWIPASLWLFRAGRPGWGAFMLAWGVGVSTIDHVVKPWLISQGARLPFILILFGVLGGVMAFGFIGLFLGPTLLAVGFRLMREWAAGRRAAGAGGAGEEAGPPSGEAGFEEAP
jgi:predicted PurR-regulated permease PerM